MATSLESFAKEHCQHCWGQIKAGWFQEQTHRERISQETRLFILRHPQTPVSASVCPGPRESSLLPTWGDHCLLLSLSILHSAYTLWMIHKWSKLTQTSGVLEMTFQKKGAIWHYMKTTLGVGDNYITPYSIDRDKEGSRNLGLEVTSLKQKKQSPE